MAALYSAVQKLLEEAGYPRGADGIRFKVTFDYRDVYDFGYAEIVTGYWADIGVELAQIGDAGRRTQLLKLFQPVRVGECEIIDGESPEEAAVNLALKLREAKVL